MGKKSRADVDKEEGIEHRCHTLGWGPVITREWSRRTRWRWWTQSKIVLCAAAAAASLGGHRHKFSSKYLVNKSERVFTARSQPPVWKISMCFKRAKRKKKKKQLIIQFEMIFFTCGWRYEKNIARKNNLRRCKYTWTGQQRGVTSFKWSAATLISSSWPRLKNKLVRNARVKCSCDTTMFKIKIYVSLVIRFPHFKCARKLNMCWWDALSGFQASQASEV